MHISFADLDYRPIPGFPGYIINHKGVCIRVAYRREYVRGGRVFSQPYDNLVVSWCEDKDGYLVAWSNVPGNRQLKQHRAIAEVFIPNPDGKEQVNHKNGRKSDNQISNLEWTTPQENTIHSVDTGLRVAVSGDAHYKRRQMNK